MFDRFVKQILKAAPMTQPNVILIFTDNQQAETLACYGNSEVKTPNLDRLAAQGMRFDNAFCVNAFCSPCRASALTGLLPSQHGVHSWIDDRNSKDWPKGWHALKGLTTLPQELQSLGYTTGLFGKYHLGDAMTKPAGWDKWVSMADGHVRSFYKNRICEDGDIYEQPGHSVDFFTDKAVDFIKTAKGPYFAYIPFPAPYGHWPATNDGNRNRHAEDYDDCPMNSVPREALSADAVKNFEMINSQSSHDLDFSMLMRAPNHLPTLRNYYSQIAMIDDAVGRIMEADPDALIIFTADHGLSLGHHGFWGHGGSTYPSNLHRGAHSIPMIVSHQGQIAPQQSSDAMVSNMDLFSTVIDCAGGTPSTDIPSRTLAGLFFDNDNGEAFDEVYSEQEETRVLRTKDWVIFKRYNGPTAPQLPDALYHSRSDPWERTNFVDDPEYQDVLAQLSAKIEVYFDKYAQPQADMWQGGKPIQNSMLKPYWQGIWGEGWEPTYGYSE